MKQALTLLALAFAAPAMAKSIDEPLVATYPGTVTTAANAVAVACVARGWGISERTDYAVTCSNLRADPGNKATFNFIDHAGQTTVQVVTREPGAWGPNSFEPSTRMQKDVAILFAEIGAVPK